MWLDIYEVEHLNIKSNGGWGLNYCWDVSNNNGEHDTASVNGRVIDQMVSRSDIGYVVDQTIDYSWIRPLWEETIAARLLLLVSRWSVFEPTVTEGGTPEQNSSRIHKSREIGFC